MRLLLRRARLVVGVGGAGSADDPAAAGPVDVLVEDGRVAALAPRLDAAALRGEGSGGGGSGGRGSDEVLDLDGRWLVPGLWDEHVHLAQTALTRHRVDVSAAASAAEAAAIVGAAAAAERSAGRDAAASAGVPLVGQGFRDALWPDTPTAALLDAAVGDREVVLISADVHTCWLNSAALARSGHATDPAHPTGVLREAEAFAVGAALRDVPAGVLDAWVGQVTREAAARGVVGVVDLEITDGLPDWTRRVAAGPPAVRVEVGVYPQHLRAALAAGLRTGSPVPGADRGAGGGGPLVTVGPLKVFTDGSLNTRTALCADPYPGLTGPGAHGVLATSREQLVELLTTASGAGFVPAVHAIGDEANTVALDAFAAAGTGGRIEHAQLLHEADLPRFAALGVAASVQPEHAMDDRDVADRYWAGRTRRAFPLAALRGAGARLLLGSDSPVAPLDPWVTAAAAVERSRDGREPWHPEQAIPVAAALAASVRAPLAVAAGARADLAVVEADPLTAPPARLRAMPVALTLLGGRITHTAL